MGRLGSLKDKLFKTIINKKMLDVLLSLIVIILFFTASLEVIKQIKNEYGSVSDLIFITILLAPILIFLILIGKFKEIQGPGGIAIKAAEVANEPIKALTIANDKIATIDPQKVEKGRLSDLSKEVAKLTDEKPIIMTMVLGNEDYQMSSVNIFIKELLVFPSFKFVVFLDSNGKFVAFTTPSTIYNITSISGLRGDEERNIGSKFIDAIRFARVLELFNHPRVIKESLSMDSTNSDAMKLMAKYHLDAFIVINNENKLEGVIERSKIVNETINVLYSGK